MRLAKTEALKKDIEILSQNHERDVDRKDAILQMLDRYLHDFKSLCYKIHIHTVIHFLTEILKRQKISFKWHCALTY